MPERFATAKKSEGRGISRSDAENFLTKYGVTGDELRTAVLHVCTETTAEAIITYSLWSLGLCVEAIVAESARGIATAASTFDIAPNDAKKIVERFLQALTEEDRNLVE